MANRSKVTKYAKKSKTKVSTYKKESRLPEKQKVPTKDIVPEIFDSSSANAIKEMK
jgi:hypothetical protein